jgi:hypothetical protein
VLKLIQMLMARTPRSLLDISGKEADMRKVIAASALGLAGFFGVTACAGVLTPSPSLPLAASTNHNSMAREIMNIAVGKGGLSALDDGDGQAASAYCDPSTVSSRPNVTTTSTSASCGINYSDGSVWKQTVTVVFDSHSHPVTDSTTLGTEVLQPTDGRP